MKFIENPIIRQALPPHTQRRLGTLTMPPKSTNTSSYAVRATHPKAHTTDWPIPPRSAFVVTQSDNGSYVSHYPQYSKEDVEDKPSLASFRSALNSQDPPDPTVHPAGTVFTILTIDYDLDKMTESPPIHVPGVVASEGVGKIGNWPQSDLLDPAGKAARKQRAGTGSARGSTQR
jgi:hypothetical protein